MPNMGGPPSGNIPTRPMPMNPAGFTPQPFGYAPPPQQNMMPMMPPPQMNRFQPNAGFRNNQNYQPVGYGMPLNPPPAPASNMPPIQNINVAPQSQQPIPMNNSQFAKPRF